MDGRRRAGVEGDHLGAEALQHVVAAVARARDAEAPPPGVPAGSVLAGGLLHGLLARAHTTGHTHLRSSPLTLCRFSRACFREHPLWAAPPCLAVRPLLSPRWNAARLPHCRYLESLGHCLSDNLQALNDCFYAVARSRGPAQRPCAP